LEDQYLDFTKDWADEREKWFIPVYAFHKEDDKICVNLFIKELYKQGNLQFVFSWKGDHSCKSGKGFISNKQFHLSLKQALENIQSLFDSN
jgi:hypothetical protein